MSNILETTLYLYCRVKSISSQLESYLVISFSSCTMGNILCSFCYGHIDHCSVYIIHVIIILYIISLADWTMYYWRVTIPCLWCSRWLFVPLSFFIWLLYCYVLLRYFCNINKKTIITVNTITIMTSQKVERNIKNNDLRLSNLKNKKVHCLCCLFTLQYMV
jgi:hypothetical protein